MTDDKKTLKFQMMMSPAEAKELDDWMFKNRIRSRAEAIRRLCQIGILFDDNANALSKNLFSMMLQVLEKSATLCEKSEKLLDKNNRTEEDIQNYVHDTVGLPADFLEKSLVTSTQLNGLIASVDALKSSGNFDDAYKASIEEKNNSFSKLIDTKNRLQSYKQGLK